MVAAQTKQVWQEKLAMRGVLDAAQEAGWHEFAWFNTPGWAYPLYQANGAYWTLGKDAGVASSIPHFSIEQFSAIPTRCHGHFRGK